MRSIVTVSLSGILLLAACLPAAAQRARGPAMDLTTSAFADGGVIPDKYTQADANPVSPPLEWTNVSPQAQTLVLILHDMDVALGGNSQDVLHWGVFNVPASAAGLPENVPTTEATLPDGTVQLKSQRGAVGYMGPGAPAGRYHHYAFELFALDTKLALGPDASRADVMAAMEGHIVGKATLAARFHR